MARYFDNHNHSQFSFDGKRTTIEKTARSAKEKGLAGICFTDHFDAYIPSMKEEFEGGRGDETFDIAVQQAEIDRVEAAMWDEKESFRIFKGIELGVYRDAREELGKVLEDNSFDSVIASVHYLDDTDPYWGPYYEGKSWKGAYGHYMEVHLEEMKWLGKRFDIMGHFDYITRYAPYPESSILWRDFPDLLDEILSFLSDEGKALEINTKTYQTYKGRTPILDPDIIHRYMELGGEFISLGSDSHDSGAVGFNFENTALYLKSLGMKWAVHYESRKPVVTPL